MLMKISPKNCWKLVTFQSNKRNLFGPSMYLNEIMLSVLLKTCQVFLDILYDASYFVICLYIENTKVRTQCVTWQITNQCLSNCHLLAASCQCDTCWWQVGVQMLCQCDTCLWLDVGRQVPCQCDTCLWLDVGGLVPCQCGAGLWLDVDGQVPCQCDTGLWLDVGVKVPCQCDTCLWLDVGVQVLCQCDTCLWLDVGVQVPGQWTLGTLFMCDSLYIIGLHSTYIWLCFCYW